MSSAEALRLVHEHLASGYAHHRYEAEQLFLRTYFHSPVADAAATRSLPDYSAVLGPNPMRATKNGAICFVTVTSRAAIDHGVGSELAFTLSDHYINSIEETTTVGAVAGLVSEMLSTYHQLVRTARAHLGHSLLVNRALSTIDGSLYGRLAAADVARRCYVDPTTLNRALRSELGWSTHTAIHRAKVREAEYLLGTLGKTVSEVADLLGYANHGHFSRVFRQHTGRAPSEVRVGSR